jgi:hypothetical protein
MCPRAVLNTRTQLTLFVAPPAAEILEPLRRRLDPVQSRLISAHVTLCREDELMNVSAAEIAVRLRNARLRHSPWRSARRKCLRAMECCYRVWTVRVSFRCYATSSWAPIMRGSSPHTSPWLILETPEPQGTTQPPCSRCLHCSASRSPRCPSSINKLASRGNCSRSTPFPGPIAARPNPSLNHRTHYGGSSWPGLGYAVHSPNPGQAVPP